MTLYLNLTEGSFDDTLTGGEFHRVFMILTHMIHPKLVVVQIIMTSHILTSFCERIEKKLKSLDSRFEGGSRIVPIDFQTISLI